MNNESNDERRYDYIVVGTGAAGSVLAAELSASGAQVLIIESGGPDDAPTILDPSIWFYNVGGPLDYHLPIVPSPRLDDRKFYMALGHVLGGGTSINAMVWIRGAQADYDGWAENGAKGWGFADVLPVFKSQEDWEGGANEWRGSGGPIHIRRPKDPHPTAPAFIEAARQMGMPILDDLNGPMGPGAGYINMNIAADGTRVSAARAARISKSNSASEEKSCPKSDKDVGQALWQTKAQRRQAMSFRISTLLTRNLHDVFGENDPVRRRSAIDEIFTEDCVFYEPNGGVYRGRDEIDRIAGVIRATHTDFRYQPIAEPEELGNAGRVKWVEGRPGEAPAVAGTDFIIARDGRIAAVYLFFDKLP
jgi:hypothetical protein